MLESLIIHAHRLEAGRTVSTLWHNHSNTSSLPSTQYAISSLNTLITAHEARLHLLYEARRCNLSAFPDYSTDIEKLKIGLEIFRDARRLFHAEALRHSKQAPGQTLRSYIQDVEKLLRAQPVLDGRGRLILGTFTGLDVGVQCATLETGKAFLHTSLPEFIRIVRAAQGRAAGARLAKVEGWVGFMVGKRRQGRMSSSATAVGSEDHDSMQGRSGSYTVAEGRKRIKVETSEQARKIWPMPQRSHARRESVNAAYQRAAINAPGSRYTDWDAAWVVDP